MGTFGFGLLLLGLVWIFNKRKKLPKASVWLAAIGSAGLTTGLALSGWYTTVTDWIDGWAVSIVTRINGGPVTDFSITSVAAVLALVWLAFEIWPKAKPGPKAVIIGLLLPLLILSVPGQPGQVGQDGLTQLNAGTNQVLGGIFG